MRQEGAKARQVLEQFLANHPEAADATLINILAELYIAAEDWQAASKLIADSSNQLSAGGELPIDLQVKVNTISCKRNHDIHITVQLWIL
jgi:thioredoxin-like negative regulator of GroEL